MNVFWWSSSFIKFYKVLYRLCDFGSAGLDDWDIIAPVDVPRYKMSSLLERNILGTLTGTLSSGMGKTLTHVQRAMGECSSKCTCTCNKRNISIDMYHILPLDTKTYNLLKYCTIQRNHVICTLLSTIVPRKWFFKWVSITFSCPM